MVNVEEKPKIKKFTDLKVWQESRALVKNAYQVCALLPDSERFGLTMQMKRASVSVASNIAEGFKRDTMKDKLRFYIMAHGSLTELQNQLIISSDLRFISSDSCKDPLALTEVVDRLLTGLIRATKERI